jgi:hypothetical protein
LTWKSPIENNGRLGLNSPNGDGVLPGFGKTQNQAEPNLGASENLDVE